MKGTKKEETYGYISANTKSDGGVCIEHLCNVLCKHKSSFQTTRAKEQHSRKKKKLTKEEKKSTTSRLHLYTNVVHMPLKKFVVVDFCFFHRFLSLCAYGNSLCLVLFDIQSADT